MLKRRIINLNFKQSNYYEVGHFHEPIYLPGWTIISERINYWKFPLGIVSIQCYICLQLPVISNNLIKQTTMGNHTIHGQIVPILDEVRVNENESRTNKLVEYTIYNYSIESINRSRSNDITN